MLRPPQFEESSTLNHSFEASSCVVQASVLARRRFVGKFRDVNDAMDIGRIFQLRLHPLLVRISELNVLNTTRVVLIGKTKLEPHATNIVVMIPTYEGYRRSDPCAERGLGARRYEWLLVISRCECVGCNHLLVMHLGCCPSKIRFVKRPPAKSSGSDVSEGSEIHFCFLQMSPGRLSGRCSNSVVGGSGSLFLFSSRRVTLPGGIQS